MKTLAFALYGRRAGLIIKNGGLLNLQYDSTYLNDLRSTPLSLSLPLQQEPHTRKAVEAYLRGLLPDNDDVRARWAAAFGVKDRNTLGLIKAIGLDCAGGAIFAPEEELNGALQRAGTVTPLSEKDIGDHLRLLRSDGGAWHFEDGEHWSLAGGQSKFTLVKTTNGWGKAEGSTASTHIIKPGIDGLSFQALIEHVSMASLAEIGEMVAESKYYEFDGEPAIVVTRFDRIIRPGDEAVRLHSEDFLQAFSLDPMRKYESDGGPGIARISGLLRAVTEDDSAERFMRAVVANYLLGAPDAHAKNYSILLAQKSVSLAPLYDVASGLTHTDSNGKLRFGKNAMSIGGQNRIGEVNGKNWRKFAATVGFSADQVRAVVESMASALPDAMHDVIRGLPKNTLARKILIDQLLPHIESHTTRTIELLD